MIAKEPLARKPRLRYYHSMPTLNPFRAWLYSRELPDLADRLGVTRTTIREWRTGRGAPNHTRYASIKRLAKRDGVTLTTDDLLPSPRTRPDA